MRGPHTAAHVGVTLPGVRVLKLMVMAGVVGALPLAGAVAIFRSTNTGHALEDAVVRVIDTDEGVELETLEDLVKYLEAHPDRYALAAWNVGAEDAGLFHDADRAWPLASTVKVVPLALASEELAAGRWDANTPTPEVERFYLPGTDGNAHPEASRDGGTSTVGGAIHGMIAFSDNAATDALLFRLGRSRLTSTQEGLPTPHPLSGTMLLAREGFDGAAWARAARLLTERETVEGPGISLAAQEAMTRTLDNRGTPRAFARLMERLFTDDSQKTAVARKELSWPMVYESNQRDFVVFATKGGSLPGSLTSALYAETKSGQRRVAALFLHDLPFATYLSLSQSDLHQKLERELLLSPDALVRLRGLAGSP